MSSEQNAQKAAVTELICVMLCFRTPTHLKNESPAAFLNVLVEALEKGYSGARYVNPLHTSIPPSGDDEKESGEHEEQEENGQLGKKKTNNSTLKPLVLRSLGLQLVVDATNYKRRDI